MAIYEHQQTDFALVTAACTAFSKRFATDPQLLLEASEGLLSSSRRQSRTHRRPPALGMCALNGDAR